METDIIAWIQNWYFNNCNGDWEHTFGIKINTLDNPGWCISIDLEETPMENINFQTIDLERTENDWIMCKVNQKKFEIACGSLNLLEALNIFRDWTVSNTD
jgi:Immunity protein 53